MRQPVPAPSAAPASARYLLLLALGCLALPAAWVAVVLGSASWAELRTLDALFPYYDWHIRPLTPAQWRAWQQGAWALAGGLGLAWLLLGPLARAGRVALSGLGAEVVALGRIMAGRWWALPRGQRWFFGAHLAVLTAVRLYLSLHLHWADDAVSYEFFVRQRLLAPAAYYPLPNNHVLSNVLDWAFYQVYPRFWWSMRLPVLLAATAGTVGLWAGLLRRLGYWPALLAAGLMSWSELSLFHAGAGRGYWLVADAAGVAFLAVLALQEEAGPGPRPAAAPRLAWLALAGAGLVGTYAVPVGVYALLSAWSWLALRAGLTRAWHRLAALAGVGGAVGAGVLLLYGPLLLVSGPAALLANTYVRRLGGAEFWAQLPRFIWLTEGQLLGQRYVGAGAALLVVGLFGGLWRRAGQVPRALAAAVRQVGLPALWFVALPYAVLLVQRVLPPERTWLYKTWFMGILAALVLAGWHWQRPARRWLLASGLLLYAGYQVGNQLRLDHYAWQGRAGHRAVEAWLAAHPQANPALMPDLYIWGWFRFNAHIEHPERPFTAGQQSGRLPYRSLVTAAGQPLPPGTGALWFQADGLRVWHLRQR